ncbi:MAG: hypothetical protein NVS3B3_04500 [Aquirhabdus sp.]
MSSHAIKMKPTTAPIADLIAQLNKAMEEKYAQNYSVVVTNGEDPISVATSITGYVPPVIEKPQTMKVPTIQLLGRFEDGWITKRQAPPESSMWSKRDRSWIDTMLECGDQLLIIGDEAYRIVMVEGNA